MLRRQRLYAGSHQCRLFAKVGCLVWQRTMIGHILDAVLEFSLIVPRERGEGQGAPRAHQVAVTIQQNRAKPREEPATSVVSAQALPGFDQGVLSQVFGQGGVAAKREGLSQQACFMGPTGLPERLSIAGLSPVQEAARVWSFDVHELWCQAEHISIINNRKRRTVRSGTVRSQCNIILRREISAKHDDPRYFH